MRRKTRGGRMLALGIFFFIYSAINVYSASDVTISSIPNGEVDLDLTKESTFSPKYTTAFPSNEDFSSSVSPLETTSAASASSTKSSTVEQKIDEKRIRTYRQKRNCTPPAIEQFPPPLFPPWFREKGGLILHILIAIFTFLGLAIVCDDYFVSSLDRICEGNFS